MIFHVNVKYLMFIKKNPWIKVNNFVIFETKKIEIENELKSDIKVTKIIMTYIINVLIEWVAKPPITLTFDKVPTAGEVLQKLIDEKIFDPDKYKFAHIYGYQLTEMISSSNVLLSNDTTLKRPRFTIWNWVFPIIFWSSISIPYILRIYSYSKDFCALCLVGILCLLAFAAYKLHTEAIFYPKRKENSLNKYEMCYILFFMALSPALGQDNVLDMLRSDFDYDSDTETSSD